MAAGSRGLLCTLVAGSDCGLGQALGKVLPGTLRGLCLPQGPAASEAPQAAGPGTKVGAPLRGPAQGWQLPGQPRRPLGPLASPPCPGAAGIAALGTRAGSGMALN